MRKKLLNSSFKPRSGPAIRNVLEKEENKEMTAEPIQVTDESFEKDVLQSSLPVIVDFWAPWCGPCKMVAPILDKIAAEMDGKLVVAKVNTDEHAEWMQKFGIQGIPTMLFVSGGKVVHRQVGALPERMLRDVVAQFMDVISQN
jgi:thioredoxin 1